MPEQKIYISVILPLRLEWEPCYYAGPGIGAGMRVSVRFAGRTYIGVVSASGIAPQIDESKIQPVLAVEYGLPQVTDVELRLWRFVAEYYLCTIGEVYKAAYPALKIGHELVHVRQVERARIAAERRLAVLDSRISRLETGIAQRLASAEKARKDASREKYLAEAERLKAQKDSLAAERSTIAAAGRPEGIDLDNACRAIGSGGSGGFGCAGMESGFALSDAQKTAVAKIKDAFSAHKPVLLDGVTGSGKTEIYMTLAMETLAKGLNVLYLIPEIAVSRQMEVRLRKIFGSRLKAFHSKETAARRQEIASEVRSGSYIVLGTRSALFLPHHDLGLIIVDEEHDTSYKQDAPAPRYNGRDTALMLSRICGSDIVLGTATPSLESLYNCRIGRMVKVDLRERYFGSEDSDVEIIDTSAERRKHGMSGSFSFKLISHIRETLAAGGQVLILRARRAYSPAVQCSSCGDIPRCPHCNVPLSWHRQEGILLCHYCGWRVHYTGFCTKCGSPLVPLGAGTQRIEEEAGALFPGARIARLDSDTAMSSGRESSIIRDFAQKKIDILIGTQIITKGFDFDGLSLVAVLQADSLLGQQDFRADERAVQLLEQFRGRSGRRGAKGLLAVQTSQPSHPVYQALEYGVQDDAMHDALVDRMMEERYMFGYPPFSRIVRIILKDIDEERAARMSAELASAIRSGFGLAGFVQDNAPEVSVLGPYAPAVDRQSDQFIRNIRVSLKKDGALASNKARLASLVRKFETDNAYTSHIALDVDP